MTTRALPLSRQDLIVKELDTELLVYDEQSKKAYCLNESSAVIWKQCDGKTTIAQVSSQAQGALSYPIDEAFVTFALARMDKYGLLAPGYSAPPNGSVMTRTQLMKRVGRAGIAAAVAVPLITAIMAPTAAKAYGHHHHHHGD